MRIQDTEPTDWSLYFEGTYMMYRNKVAAVSVDTEGPQYRLMLTFNPHKRVFLSTPEELAELEVWWPRPGAYNYMGHAVYIARKAARNMKKSCCPRSHYYIKYGNNLAVKTVRYLKTGPNHMDWPSAKKALDKLLCASVAVARDLILLSTDEGNYGVVYRGEHVGHVTVTGEFHASTDLAPSTKLVNIRLMEEGVID